MLSSLALSPIVPAEPLRYARGQPQKDGASALL